MMPTSTRPTIRDERTRAAVVFYETLTPLSLDALPTVYIEDARFVDPFNDVTGHAAIRHIFEHMFASLDAPRFEVLEAITEAEQCFLLWHFRFRSQRGERCIQGGSHLRFATDGRVALHRDYWDPARELYEELPVLGWLMRLLRRKLSATASRP